MKRKVLVCGSTGFIGRNIAEFLAEDRNFEVYGTFFRSEPLNNPNIKMVQSDLTNKAEVDTVIKGMDVIIQAAATTSGVKDSVEKPYYHVTDNAIMNSLIFRAAYEHIVSHVVFFSCSIMYQSSDVPIKETDFDASQDIYSKYFGAGWTKVYNEKMCEFYSGLGHSNFTVVRHSNIYGPYDKFDLERSHVFGATVTKVLSAEDGGEVIIWGNGKEERDLLYVSDLSDFIKLVICKQDSRFELYNVGYGSSVSVENLVKEILQYSGKELRISYDRTKPSINTKLCLDTTKARDSLGWSPKISREDGIKKTMEWYIKNVRQ